jgi:hypothetical protein
MSGKKRVGGVRLFVNNSWCAMSNIKVVSRYYSPEVEYLMISCRPHFLPREFSSIFYVVIYLPSETIASTKNALNELYEAISKQNNAHPEAALIVAGDFNVGKLKSVLPNIYKHVTCTTIGKKTLDHLYSTHNDAYKALPRPPFSKSDHNYILLIPAYKQKQEVPVTRSIQKWSDDADAMLQDCFASTDWTMFRDSSNGIEEYTTSVTGFINKCIDDFVSTVTVRIFPNQKPWTTGNIYARAFAFKERDTNPDAYIKSRFALR